MTSEKPVRLDRRRLLARAGLLGAGGLVGSSVVGSSIAGAVPESSGTTSQTVPFYGNPHQPGIVDPARTQDHLAIAGFDLTATGRTELIDLLRSWTAAAAAMTEGRLIGGGIDESHNGRSYVDPGDALDRSPGFLTVTIGFGAPLFDERFGLGRLQPAALVELSPLPFEDLDPAFGYCDMAIQACSNDSQIALHAIRTLASLAEGAARVKWLQVGFLGSTSTLPARTTPRNLQGFRDGTRNIPPTDGDLLDRYVWVGGETEQSWMLGGTYQVVRRIRMNLNAWDRSPLRVQEDAIGRRKVSGAPLTGRREFDTPNFEAVSSTGSSVIPQSAHIRLASHEFNQGVRILRRGYNFADSVDPNTGEFDAGLIFIAFMRNISQFVGIQFALGAGGDGLGEFITHVGSATFACPPGTPTGDYWGSALFR